MCVGYFFYDYYYIIFGMKLVGRYWKEQSHSGFNGYNTMELSAFDEINLLPNGPL